MRVLYFSDNSSVHNRRFLEKLAATGHDVWFLDSLAKELPPGWLPTGIRVWIPRVALPASASPRECREFLPEFQRCLDELQPDIVHAGPVTTAAYLAVLADFHPLLVASWGSDILAGLEDPTLREAIRIALQGADGFFCDCDAVRTAALEFAEIPGNRIAQFPWGVKPGVFSPHGPLPRDVEWNRDVFSLISTRSWEPLYGTLTMLEAFRLAHAKEPKLRLILLGAGSQEAEVRDFVAQHRLEEAVLMPGVVTAAELPAWFRVAKGYISCTKSDGTSVSLLEAMATGLPVLVSDLPANREWVREGENGWLAPPESAQGFTSGMLEIAALTSDEREAISARNQAVIAERADWDRNFPRLLALYDLMVKDALQTKKAG